MTQLFNKIKQGLGRIANEYAGAAMFGIVATAPFVFQVNVPLALGMVCVGIAIFAIAIMAEEMNDGE